MEYRRPLSGELLAPDLVNTTWPENGVWRDVLADRPNCRRGCANGDCVLWFLDTTRSGTRRWCSMAGCGNRLEARRHYRRQYPD
jgi:CGNR zinc finger